jgi:hypothetical protein
MVLCIAALMERYIVVMADYVSRRSLRLSIPFLNSES